MPPFHMFFLFAFGLAQKQIWLSQYLRPNINFPYLDSVFTLGGAGFLTNKFYNGRKWDIIPQIASIDGIMDCELTLDKPKILFTPARLEKLKQHEFMECVAQILDRAPFTHFKWTGYYRDAEVVNFFKSRGLSHRHTYLPWMDAEGLKIAVNEADIILACFPLSLGTVENIAAHYGVPVISLFDDECNHYWRDIYWEAINGNEDLRQICFDEFGNSRILISKTPDEYVDVALRVLLDPELASLYADVYRKTYDYAYHRNPNHIGRIFSNIIHGANVEKEVTNYDVG